MTDVLQINLHRSGPALNLARQTAAERRVDIVFVSEQPRGPPDSPEWTSSVNRASALYLSSDSNFVSFVYGSDVGVAWMRSKDLAILNCYTSKNSTADMFN